MKSNPVQFAVVREDPEIEAALMSRLPGPAHAMLVGSGGCTALTLACRFPSAFFTLLEPNPSQIELILKKTSALRTLRGEDFARTFAIGAESEDSLNTCGNFESLFKSLRLFTNEFILDQEGWRKIFGSEPAGDLLEQVFASKYWPVAFQLFFSDDLLRAMFGPMAIQHASPGSYPVYFQGVFERGLRAKNAKQNYFLHHVFLGHYLEDCLPPYLSAPAADANFKFINVLAQDVPSFKEFDLLSFSNIFDWMEEGDVAKLANKAGTEMKPGAFLIYRQLNNTQDLRPLFGLKFDDKLSRELHSKDRSLFYSSLHVARKV